MGASSENTPLSPARSPSQPSSSTTFTDQSSSPSLGFSSPSANVFLSRYHHFSALRTTTDVVVGPMADLRYCAAGNQAEVCHCADHGGIAPLACEECVQECADVPCTIGLTPECTDQCVVVPCNDAHHQGPEFCDHAANEFCEAVCRNGADCTSLEDFFQCCTDYHGYLSEPRTFPPDTVPNNHGFVWDQSSLDAFLCSCSGIDSRVGHAQASISTSNIPSFPNMNTNTDIQSSTMTSTASHPELTADIVPHLNHRPPPYLPSTEAQHAPESQMAAMKCMWGNCSATFTSLSELVGHVNLTHLRLPSPPEPTSAAAPPAQTLQHVLAANMDPHALSCLWADCHVYPTPQSIPGPSTGNAADSAVEVLASHLIEHHLGLPTRTPKQDDALALPRRISAPKPLAHDVSAVPLVPALSPVLPTPCPPTPLPEHDCSAPSAHNCGWDGCGETFASCDDLTAHIAITHVGGGKAHYDCRWQGCKRHGEHGFASKQKILRHLQSHTGHRPFQCKICSQNFSEAATLAQHMRRHTQEKPYVCDFPGCGKAFAITGALTIHKRTHNGHRPFKCTYCERAFAESSNLSKHLRTHTGARPYLCAEPGCTKSFARPDQLTRHMNVHRKKSVDRTASPMAMEAS